MDPTITKVEELMSAGYDGFDQMFRAIEQLAAASASDREQLGVYLEGQSSPHAEQALKLAVIALILGRFARAVEILRSAPEGQDKRWMLGLAFKGQGDYAHALADFQRALTRGFDEVRVRAEMVECHRRAGDLAAAGQELKKLEKAGSGSARYFFQAAGIAEAEGQFEQAAELLDQAVETDPDYIPALFRLAYLEDLKGDEGRAIELYDRCLRRQPTHVNALINRAVLHEDAAEFTQAAGLLRRVLDVYPNHGRARLFLRDVESSMSMYYDEDLEKRKDKFHQVLEMPISDFELSVRSRNCLKKMGIKTLGDLTRITESELLSYKNFGETSLSEIKVILTSKNLRLGQAVEDQASKKAANILPGGESQEEQEDELTEQSELAKSIDELKLSVRSKKCLQKLNVETIGHLAEYTEAQLMAIKNFGNVSLREVQEKLTELGLALRKAEE